MNRPTNQVHFCLATPACDRTSPRRHAYAVLDTILGGGTSSRLFHEIREKRGLAYSIGSYLQLLPQRRPLHRGRRHRAGELRPGARPDAPREIAGLRRTGPTAAELERAKTQVHVALALAAESTSFRMQHLAVSELVLGPHPQPSRRSSQGSTTVTAEDVHALAREVSLRNGRRWWPSGRSARGGSEMALRVMDDDERNAC